MYRSAPASSLSATARMTIDFPSALMKALLGEVVYICSSWFPQPWSPTSYVKEAEMVLARSGDQYGSVMLDCEKTRMNKRHARAKLFHGYPVVGTAPLGTTDWAQCQGVASH